MNKPDQPAKILVVEDEGIVGLDIRKRLLTAGYEVSHVAVSAEEALRSMESVLPDLVLMDIHIQGRTDGVEAAEKIRQLFHIPIIFVTAHADSITLERAKTTEPFGYIVKPISMLSLTSTIEMALHKHQIEKRLSEHRAWMATVLGGIPEGVIVTDIRGKVEFANAAAEKLVGRKQPAMVLRDVASIVPLSSPTVTELTAEALQCAILSGSFQLPRETFLSLSGSADRIPIEGQVAISYVDERMAGAIFTLRDASKREQEDMQIRQEQKMLALGELASDISQTFYELFNAIANANSQLKHFADSSPKSASGSVLHEAESIQRASRMGMLMSRQLTKLGSQHSLRPQSVDVNHVINTTAPALEKLSGAALELQLELCAEPALVLCHASHLEQVLLNVVVSSREYLGGSGRIRLTTQIIIGNREQVRIHFALKDSDSPFANPVNVSIERGNPDLDLSVASAIITAAEGVLRFERQSDGKGEIEILLPRQRPSIQMEPEFADRRGIVLLVGTETPATRIVEQQLESDHYATIGSANASEALFVAQFYDGEITAVVADADGVSPHNRQRIRKAFLDRNGKTKFICLTPNLEGIEPDWHPITKPFQTRDIANTLETLLTEEPIIRAAHN